MPPSTLPPLEIRGRRLDVPIVQGGMGVGISRYRLAGTVAACGGMGTLAAQGLGSASTLPAETEGPAKRRHEDPHGLAAITRETRAAVELANGRGIVAVNVMMAVTHFPDLVQAALDGGAQAIVSGAGLPLNLPTLTQGHDVALIPIVSSARALKLVCRHWSTFNEGRLPDAVVVEGPLAGGHLGFGAEQVEDPEMQLQRLIPRIVEEARRWGDFPIIAAGGVWDHADARELLDLGAGAVQLGTRFVVTEECDVDPYYKSLYLAATREDITLIKTPVGMTGRVLKTALIERFARQDYPGFKCFYQCLAQCHAHAVRYCIADHLLDAARGDPEGFYFIGAKGWRCDEILPVAELMSRLAQGPSGA